MQTHDEPQENLYEPQTRNQQQPPTKAPETVPHQHTLPINLKKKEGKSNTKLHEPCNKNSNTIILKPNLKGPNHPEAPSNVEDPEPGFATEQFLLPEKGLKTEILYE